MKRYFSFIIFLIAASAAMGDLSDFERADPRFSVKPILKRYDQIQGFNAQVQAWNRDFKGKYGNNWEILIDLRGGRPGYVSGQGIPVIPGIGVDTDFCETWQFKSSRHCRPLHKP
jgi:hypothetical protein